MKPEPDTPAGASQTDLSSLAAQTHQALVEKNSRLQALQARHRLARQVRWGTLGAAIVVAVALLWYGQSRVTPPTDEQIEKGRMAMLGLISTSLADYLRSHGSYPDRLEDALHLSLEPQVVYRRTGSGYEIGLRGPDGKVFVLRHG